MTVAEEPSAALPRFRAVVARHLDHMRLDDESRDLVEEALARGSAAVRRLPGGDRAAFVDSAAAELDAACQQMVSQLRAVGVMEVDRRTLEALMLSFPSVPPFCNKGGQAQSRGT